MTARFLLDTNIISEATKLRPSPALTERLSAQLDESLHITTLSVAEIRRGILEKEIGRRRLELETRFTGPEGPQALFVGRVLPFSELAALEWARIMSEGTLIGRPRSALDMVVAATAAAHGLTVVTANEKHFRDTGVPWFNPLASSD